MNKILERLKGLTNLQLQDSQEDVYTIVAHLCEELGEFCTAICIEDGSTVKGYKKISESSSEEAIDVMICALSAYYARGGKTEDISSILSKKLTKWENKINGK